MDELAQYLLKKETITGDEFMAILHGTMEQAEPETVETTVVPENGTKWNKARSRKPRGPAAGFHGGCRGLSPEPPVPSG